MENLNEILKSILFVAGDAVQFSDIAEKLELEITEVKTAFKELEKETKEQNLGIQVMVFNNKAQLCSNPDFASHVAEVLNPIREKQLTKAVMDVCSIIAYRQPITRLEVENIRGVNSDYAISSLLENNLIEVVGRKDAVGKPLLFGTTDNFLKKFGLESLEDLPDYEELLDRIKVIKETVNNSLFDFREIPDESVTVNVNINNPVVNGDIHIDATESPEKALEELEEELLSDILDSGFIGKDSDDFSETDDLY